MLEQAAHPALQRSEHLQHFLELDENSWAIEMARGTQEATRRKPGAFQFLRDFGMSTANMINGKTLDEEEDPEYLKVKAGRILWWLVSGTVSCICVVSTANLPLKSSGAAML